MAKPKTVELYEETFIMRQQFTPKELEGMMLKSGGFERSLYSNNYEIKFYSNILAQKLDFKSATYPKNWKEAVKERFMPKFLLKWFPVSYTTIEIRAVQLYPKIALPDGYGPCITMTKYNPENYEE